MQRNRTLRLVAAAVLALPLAALAQAIPTKPVKIIIGFPAGGPLDAHARLLAERLGQLLGQPVIIDYRSGAGGTVGADFVAKSEADGHTLLMANTGTMVINPAIYTKIPYQTLKNFDVVGLYGVLAPAGTPRAAVDRLSAAFKATLETPEIRTKMVTQGADPAFLGADDFAQFLAAEMPKWAKAVKDSGAKLD